MPEDRGARRGPLTELVAYYGDLGVRELFVAPPATGGTSSRGRGSVVPEPQPATGPVAVLAPRTPDATDLGPAEVRSDLARLAAEVAACRRCTLCETRKQTVFSDGSPTARLMFVGEAPGADEDAQGVPFVGKAGQLLTKMIEAGMGLSRQDVYICNVLKCRPPGNRNPLPDEIAQCRGYLESQVELVKPEVIVALGNFASKFLLETEEGINRLRGRWASYRGIPVMPTFHPSFLLRSPDRKRDAWEDLLKVLEKLGLPAKGR